jgi:hypothetical protein
MAAKPLMTSLILMKEELHSQLQKKQQILCKPQVQVDEVPFLERMFT